MNEFDIGIRLLLAALATWRLTHLLAAEDGPGDCMVKLRRRLGEGFWGRLMDCFACLSFWVAAPLAFFVTQQPRNLIITWLALSGAACLLERIGVVPFPPESLCAGEERENEHGLLRTTTNADQKKTGPPGDSGGAPSGN